MQTAFEAKYIPEPNTGCWLWLGQINQEGYGRTRLADGRSQVAHRAVYEAEKGITIPEGMQLDHTCYMRCCVNPEHLEIVTQQENIRRAFTRSRGFGYVSTTHCMIGHEMTGSNVWLRKNQGGVSRVCRECARQARAKYRAKQSA